MASAFLAGVAFLVLTLAGAFFYFLVSLPLGWILMRSLQGFSVNADFWPCVGLCFVLTCCTAKSGSSKE